LEPIFTKQAGFQIAGSAVVGFVLCFVFLPVLQFGPFALFNVRGTALDIIRLYEVETLFPLSMFWCIALLYSIPVVMFWWKGMLRDAACGSAALLALISLPTLLTNVPLDALPYGFWLGIALLVTASVLGMTYLRSAH
jgi:hypothetical protein